MTVQQTSTTTQQTMCAVGSDMGRRTHVHYRHLGKGRATQRVRSISNARAKGGGRPPACGFAPTAGLSVCQSIGSVGNFCAHTFDIARTTWSATGDSRSNRCADNWRTIERQQAVQQTLRLA